MPRESISVFDAVSSRYTCRAFLPDPVPESTIRDILERAARAPSGGNIQPWRVEVLTGAPLKALTDEVSSRIVAEPRGEPAEYTVYPPAMPAEMQARRFAVGEALYASIGVPREDRAGRLRQFRRNFQLFGAPLGLFVSLDRRMGAPQWADCGMFLQTIALLARGHGLATCMQEAWSAWAKTVARHIDLPQSHILFCGIGIGRPDESAPINSWRSQREAVEVFARFRGFLQK
jgi:nitroreductase